MCIVSGIVANCLMLIRLLVDGIRRRQFFKTLSILESILCKNHFV